MGQKFSGGVMFVMRLSVVLSLMGVQVANAANKPVSKRALSGGKTTVFSTGVNAYSLPSANMPLMEKLDFNVGNSFFRNPWVIAPASTDARDGLGPLMNTNGCQNCHIKDGRGHAPNGHEDNAVSYTHLTLPTKA